MYLLFRPTCILVHVGWLLCSIVPIFFAAPHGQCPWSETGSLCGQVLVYHLIIKSICVSNPTTDLKSCGYVLLWWEMEATWVRLIFYFGVSYKGSCTMHHIYGLLSAIPFEKHTRPTFWSITLLFNLKVKSYKGHGLQRRLSLLFKMIKC